MGDFGCSLNETYAFLFQVLKEFIFPTPISQPQEPSWIIEMDDIIIGIQAMVLALPVQYILLATYSSVRRRIPSSRVPEEDVSGSETGETRTNVKKQASLEEVTVEMQQKQTKHEEAQETEPTKQASLHEIKVEVPEISRKDKDEGTESNAEDDAKPTLPETIHFADNPSDGEDEGTMLEKLNTSLLIPPDALPRHRLRRRSSRHLSRPSRTISIRKAASSVSDSASIDSFASVYTESDTSDSTFGSLSDKPSSSSIPVENVGNINQNASHINEFNPMDLPDVVLATRCKNGPTRWSLLRHRKQSHLQLKDMPEPLLYAGGNGKQMKNEEFVQKPAAAKKELPRNQQFKTTAKEGTQARKDVENKQAEKGKSKNTKVETVGSSGETNELSSVMSRYPSGPKASCCTRIIEQLVQFLSKTCLPWCCGFLLWPLGLIVLGGFGFLTIFLTFAYHEGLVIKWILAAAVSVITSNLLVQPLIGILISVFGCICQKPGNLSTTSALFEMRYKYKYTKSPSQEALKADKSRSKLLHRQNLQTSPINRTGLMPRLKVMLQVIFLAITLCVVYSRHDPNMFYWNQTVRDMFVSGRATGTRGLSKVGDK